MSTVVRKSDCRIFYSVNTPDYPEVDYLINPDLAAVRDVPQEYLKIDGDRVVEMSALEKAAVDDAKQHPVVCPLGYECRFTKK